MKNFLPYLLFIIVIGWFSCQSSVVAQDVPEAVESAFKAKYPGENDPDWRIDKNGNFESHFKKKGEHYRADFSPAGNWIETESSISKKDLPDAIKDKLKKDYDDYKIVELEKVDSAAKGAFYDVELKKDGKKMDVEFRADGSIL